MAKRQATKPAPELKYEELGDSLFYGLRLDKEQEAFKKAILNKKNLAVFCNARAGTGKTLLAVGTGTLLIKAGLFDELVYIVSPVGENRQGFLPGTLAEKSQYYTTPLNQALVTMGLYPARVVKKDMVGYEKNGEAFVTSTTDTFLRGTTISKSIVIIDEAQNFDLDQLRTVLTRIPDDSKAIVIGHDKQCDLRGRESGFTKALKHFSDREWAEVCSLTTNHRGLISSWADEM